MNAGVGSLPGLRRAWLVAAVLLVALGSLGHASMHPRHVTFAEVEYVPARRVLEVALRVEARSLEFELSRGRRKIEELKRDERSARAVTSYLERNFLVWRPEDERRTRPAGPAPARTASSGKGAKRPARMDRTPLSFVGLEFEGRDVWLYFEVPLEGGLDQTRFSNRMLLASASNQVNTLIVRRGRDRATLTCTRARPRAVLREQDLLPPRRAR